MKTLPLSLSLFAALSLPSCSLFHPTQGTAKADATKPQEITMFEWQDCDVGCPPRVTIDLGEQKAHIFRGGKQVGWTYVATGVNGRETPTGHFNIMEKVVDKRSNLWGIIVDGEGNTTNWNAHNGVSRVPSGGHFVGAPMPNWMRLTGGGVGMHGGPIPNPGSPASHGCIRLPYQMAEHLYEALPSGTPVTIVN